MSSSHCTYVRIGVALQQFEISVFQALIDRHAIASNGGKHRKLPLLQIMIELAPEQGLAVIFLHVTPKTKNRQI